MNFNQLKKLNSAMKSFIQQNTAKKTNYRIEELKNHEYVILEIHKVKTRYGLNYVLVDVDYNKYWSVSKINKFIDENKNTLEVLEIKTNKYIKLCNGNKFLNLDCWNTPLKDIYQDYNPDYEYYK